MKKNKIKKLPILFIFFGFFTMMLYPSFVPVNNQTNINKNVEQPIQHPTSSQFIPRNIRIAIYNEPNITQPSYSLSSVLTNNYTALKSLLEGAGYQVSELTTNDIYDHKLMTVDYDVFIMVDNVPRENITNLVKEFWLGGGGVLGFDSALSYLLYAGIMIPESEGDENLATYWQYGGGTSHNISTRHPATKAYQVNDKFSSAGVGSCYLYWDVLLTTSVGSDVFKLANRDGDNNDATAVALDPSMKGGRVVQLPGRGDNIGTNMSSLIIDAVDWLCPRPKGRILFDLSHAPYYGIDPWDSMYVNYDSKYIQLRNNLVSRSYTIDKLYPSVSGNLTSANLAPYDLLIEVLPDHNFTATEVIAVSNWVNDGGSMLVLGDNPSVSLIDNLQNINYLLTNFDFEMNLTTSGLSNVDYMVTHPTTEGCTQLSFVIPGLIDYSGNSYPIWGNDANNIGVAAQEYGKGRVILTSDINFLDDVNIANDDNLQYGINIANWLTASRAKILLLTNEPLSTNYYVTPVARALNDLNVPFALTFNYNYLNLSLYKYNWELVIVDQPYYPMDFDIFIDYIDSGGRLIISTFMVDDVPSHPLWAKLGFSFAANAPDSVPIYPWEPGHAIFSTPAPYGADNFTSFWDYGDEGDLLSVYPNATALAGFTDTIETGNATIVLRNDGKTLFNAYLIDQFIGDVDDSTYDDCFELWINEIAFMIYQSLFIDINSPLINDIFNASAPDFDIEFGGIVLDDVWYTLNDGTEYQTLSTIGAVNQTAWDALPDGSVSLKFYVENQIGDQKYQEVSIVKDTQAPTINIVNPIADETFGATAPIFIIEILDPHLDQMWYTLGSNTTKHFFTANGSIVQSAWDLLAQGTITIAFYANDTVGNENSASVNVIKSIPSRGIPGYNLLILCGLLAGVSVILIKKKRKKTTSI